MVPEFTVYQRSPHARVPCVQCHIGEGTSWLVKSKISGLRQVFATVTNRYNLPIKTPVHNLRPARDTCEQCHWPRRFSGDLVRVYRHYLPDEANTEKRRALVLRVGGGGGQEAIGIHWHVSAKVWYLPLDDIRQEIGWVGVEHADGRFAQYYDLKRVDEVTPERIEAEKRLMDCIDCHNRATHIFRPPEELLDMALTEGRIDRELPFIKRLGLEFLSQASPNSSEAKLVQIESFYATNYPELYELKRGALIKAMTELEELAKLASFPEWEVDWRTHPDNLGHLESPGCFRCHGKLTSLPARGEGKTIDSNCNLCHSVLSPELLKSP
jgi:hypothetical protein